MKVRISGIVLAQVLILGVAGVPVQGATDDTLKTVATSTIANAIEHARSSVFSLRVTIERYDGDTVANSALEGSEKFAFMGDKRFIDFMIKTRDAPISAIPGESSKKGVSARKAS